MKKFISALLVSGALLGFVTMGTSVKASAESVTEKEVAIQELSDDAIAQISELGYDLSDPDLIIYDLTDSKRKLDSIPGISIRALVETVEHAHYQKRYYPSLERISNYNYRYKTLRFKTGFRWENSYGVEVRKESNNTIQIMDIIKVYSTY